MEQLKFDTNEDLDVGMKIKKKIKKTWYLTKQKNI